MTFWMTTWTIIFAGILLFYVGLVVVVAIGGWQDIRVMFQQLDADQNDGDTDK